MRPSALHEAVAAAGDPATVAVRTAGRRCDVGALTYGALARLVEGLARRLAGAGVGPGDRVMVVADEGPGFTVTLLAVWAAGAAVAPLDPRIAPPEAAARLAALMPRALLAPCRVPPALEAIAVAAGVPAWASARDGHRAVDLSGAPSATAPPRGATRDDVALVLATSGTTGTPKQVPLTHGNVLASLDGFASTYRLGPDDRTAVLLPLSHGHGLIGALLTTLTTGGTATFPERGRFSATAFWDDLASAAPTWLTTVPSILQIVLGRPLPPHAERPRLRFLRTCSAPLAPTIRASTERLFCAPVIEAYGMTETAHQAASGPLPADGAVTPGSVGRATGGGAMRIGSGGEIELRGPSVFTGYLEAPAATAAAFTADGWFRTGDLGTLDDAGDLTVTGRIKELVNRGGEKVSPAQVDAVLLAHPAVLDAAAYGVPDPVLGEALHAAVVLRPGRTTTTADLLAFCRLRLSPAEVPTAIHLVASIPHTPKGSPDLRRLTRQGATT